MGKQEIITKEYLLVIEKNNNELEIEIDIKKLLLHLTLITDYYAMILHDKDLNENGELCRPHYHLVVKLKKRIRKTTLLNHLAIFNKETINLNMIQAEQMSNIILSTRYLLHLDNTDKHQYAPYEIISNAPHVVNDMIVANIETGNLTAKQLIHYIYKLNYSITKIMEVIGINTFNKYAKTITAIFNAYESNPNRYDYDNNKLPF